MNCIYISSRSFLGLWGDLWPAADGIAVGERLLLVAADDDVLCYLARTAVFNNQHARGGNLLGSGWDPLSTQVATQPCWQFFLEIGWALKVLEIEPPVALDARMVTMAMTNPMGILGDIKFSIRRKSFPFLGAAFPLTSKNCWSQSWTRKIRKEPYELGSFYLRP